MLCVGEEHKKCIYLTELHVSWIQKDMMNHIIYRPIKWVINS